MIICSDNLITTSISYYLVLKSITHGVTYRTDEFEGYCSQLTFENYFDEFNIYITFYIKSETEIKMLSMIQIIQRVTYLKQFVELNNMVKSNFL